MKNENYYQKNKAFLLEYQKEYLKKRKEEDPTYKKYLKLYNKNYDYHFKILIEEGKFEVEF